MFFRRILCATAVTVALGFPHHVFAADPIKVGILIPGSKSDKGWMESGYDGLMAAEKKYGDKIKVQMIENINYADMEQAGFPGRSFPSSAATRPMPCRTSPATT
jgi:basic membrane protein A